VVGSVISQKRKDKEWKKSLKGLNARADPLEMTDSSKRSSHIRPLRNPRIAEFTECQRKSETVSGEAVVAAN
jgi:hypothetical protein